MPKRKGFLYEWMCDRSRIKSAIMFGAKGKRQRCDVREVMDNLDAYIEKTYRLLSDLAFIPSTPRKKKVYDTCGHKWRTIEYVKFFPDGIVQTLMVMAMEPTIMRGMSHWCCASIPRRGSKHAIKRVKRVIHHDKKGSKYIAKMDVRQYYHSVDHRRLIWALARKIKDKKFLKLVWDVLQTCEHGMAIGFYICQWLANFFLEPLDQYITTLPGVKSFVRYMDDIVLFGPNKKKLHKARAAIEVFLRDKLGLEMKGNWQVFPLKARPLDFVGYKFYRDHTTLRRANFLRFARQCRRAKRLLMHGCTLSYDMAASLLSRSGQLCHCDSHRIRSKYLDAVGVKLLKGVVRGETQRRQRAAKLLGRGAA